VAASGRCGGEERIKVGLLAGGQGAPCVVQAGDEGGAVTCPTVARAW
jgi:hypothetical protein